VTFYECFEILTTGKVAIEVVVDSKEPHLTSDIIVSSVPGTTGTVFVSYSLQ